MDRSWSIDGSSWRLRTESRNAHKRPNHSSNELGIRTVRRKQAVAACLFLLYMYSWRDRNLYPQTSFVQIDLRPLTSKEIESLVLVRGGTRNSSDVDFLGNRSQIMLTMNSERGYAKLDIAPSFATCCVVHLHGIHSFKMLQLQMVLKFVEANSTKSKTSTSTAT